MLKFQSKLDISRLGQIFTGEGIKYKLDDAQVYMANTQDGGLPLSLVSIPSISAAIEEICTFIGAPIEYVVGMMINRLPARTTLPWHRDYLNPTRLQPTRNPCIRRFHLPVVFNDQCWWEDEQNGVINMELGVWCGPLAYWVDHRFINDGFSERIHLIVDIDCKEPEGKYSR